MGKFIQRTQEEIERADEARFWSYVDIEEGDCWEWFGTTDRKGYGRLRAGGSKSVGAHRFSYLLHYGEFDKSLFVCHRCDNPGCVNPDHLFLGTAMDNHKDAIEKGRKPKTFTSGYAPHNRVHSDDDVRDIRRLISNGVKQTEIASMFGVSKYSIRDIKSGKKYASVA